MKKYENGKKLINQEIFSYPQRVLVIPLKINKKQRGTTKRGIFALIFGYGCDKISNYSDLIVIWDEINKKFYYFYFPHSFHRYLSEYAKGDSKTDEEAIQKRIELLNVLRKKEENKLISERKIFSYDIEFIKMAIKDRNGFWGSIPADSVDRKLKEEYLKSKRFTSLNSLLTKKELREIAIEEFLAQGNTYFLLMRDVFNDKFNLDSSIIPCSYSVVRSFLKFIGIYPKRQSGSKGRTRYPDEDRRAVIRDLRKIKKEKGFITDEDVEKVCKGYAMKPSKHLIKVLKKKAISEKNLLIKLSS